MRVELTVNGEPRSDEVEPRLLLVHYLRETCGLRAANIGCDTTSCGACTVLLNGGIGEVLHGAHRPGDWRGDRHGRRAGRRTGNCIRCSGRSAPSTGCSAASAPRAWSWRRSACSTENPHPTEQQVREGLEGNLCRCTGYHNIVPRRARRGRDHAEGDGMIPGAVRRTCRPASADARDRAAGRAWRRREGAGRRSFAAADDEAAPGRARGAHRHHRARRPVRHLASTATNSSIGATTRHADVASSELVRTDAPLLAHVGVAGRRSADPAPRHDRRLARARRPGRGPADGAWSRSAARSSCAGLTVRAWSWPTTSSPGTSRRRWSEDELLTAIRVPRRPDEPWALPEVRPPGQRLGDRRGGGDRRPDRAGQHGFDARSVRTPPSSRSRRATARRRPPSWRRKGRRRPRTFTPTRGSPASK